MLLSIEFRQPRAKNDIQHPWTSLMIPMLMFLGVRVCVMRCGLPFCSIAGYGTALPILMRSMQRCTSMSADRDDPAILISRSRGLAAACSALGHPTSVLSSLIPILAIKKRAQLSIRIVFAGIFHSCSLKIAERPLKFQNRARSKGCRQ